MLKIENPFIPKPMKKILSSGIIVLLSVSIMAQNSANLKMNLEKNKVYRLKSSSQQTITQTINGNQQTTDSKVDYTLSLKMIDATADFMVTEIHIDSMKTKTNAMGKTIIINSAVEGDIKSAEMSDVLSCFANRLSKNALYVKMDFTGKVIEIVNAKMLSDVIMKDTSSITLAGVMGSGAKKQITEMISSRSLETIIEMFSYHLPGKQVSAGDNWEINVTTTTGGMSLDINTKYHLDGINGNSSNLTVESVIKTAANAAPIISGPAKVTYDDINGISKSTMAIDIRTGLIIEDRAKTHIAGNLGISGPGFSMTMPMDINGESKVIAIQ
jgi:proteasome assembly chaperone (PAC2) family protein